jgi:hypothetical protein
LRNTLRHKYEPGEVAPEVILGSVVAPEYRSPSEYYIKFLLSTFLPDIDKEEDYRKVVAKCSASFIDTISERYFDYLVDGMDDCPDDFQPYNLRHKKTVNWLRRHNIFGLWHPTKEVKEAHFILSDLCLRDRLEPLLLSNGSFAAIRERVKPQTCIDITVGGLKAFAHYFYNRRVMPISHLLAPIDDAPDSNKTLFNYGMEGRFNSAEAAEHIGRIAYKHAQQLEFEPARADVTSSLKNCIQTITAADELMRKSDVVLKEVLNQFNKFRMKVDESTVVDVDSLTQGNHSIDQLPSQNDEDTKLLPRGRHDDDEYD